MKGLKIIMSNNSIEQFRMPRYKEIPNVGLYLEQTVKYINDIYASFDIEITSSMLSNYVKKGYIEHPVKKQYYAEQIASLLFIVTAKQTLSMENIAELFKLQKQTYTLQVAYDFFCDELEAMLENVSHRKIITPAIDEDMPFAKKVLRSVVIAISHIIYLNQCFKCEMAEMKYEKTS